jgi:hypothetical protein
MTRSKDNEPMTYKKPMESMKSVDTQKPSNTCNDETNEFVKAL